MKNLVAFQRHSFTTEQTAELSGLGFNAETREVVLSSDCIMLSTMLDESGLTAGDAISFVAPPVIASRLTAEAKNRGIRVFLPEARPNPSARKRTPFPETTPPEVVEFLKLHLSNAVEETAEGLVALGQAPFIHVKYVEV
jgi:hypothetical protein